MKQFDFKQFKVVAGYEFKNTAAKKTNIIITFIIAVIILIAGIAVPIIFPNNAHEGGSGGNVGSITDTNKVKSKLEVYDPNGLINNRELFSGSLPGYSVEFFDNEYSETIKQKIINKEIEAAIEVYRDNDKAAYKCYANDNIFSTATYMISDVISSYNKINVMSSLGLNEEQISATLTPPQIEIIDAGGKGVEQTYALTYIMIMALYMSVILYGQMVAMSIATEKSSRAMELLITSAKPNNLIFGKIMGVGAAGLCQLLIWVASVAIAIRINFDYWNEIPMIAGVVNAPVGLVMMMFVFYILGFFMFSSIFGALGSLVSRVEEINTVATPVMLIYVATFFIAISGMMAPDSTLLKVASFIPFSTPMCMFVRLSMSVVPVWQVALSIVLTVAASIFFGWLSAKIYRIGVLMYGKPPKISELAKILKNEKKY